MLLVPDSRLGIYGTRMVSVAVTLRLLISMPWDSRNASPGFALRANQFPTPGCRITIPERRSTTANLRVTQKRLVRHFRLTASGVASLLPQNHPFCK